MSRPVVYIAITDHGFGHATRTAAVAATIQQLNPDILLVLVTTAPRWLLDSYIPGDFIHRPRGFDVGVVQRDSLTMDKAATLERLREIRDRQNALVAGEVNFIRLNRVGLVLADIPPLAAAIARAAEIPCWMMSNFGWDFIYRDWGDEFIEIADWIGELFSKSDRLFRYPWHEAMRCFSHITDVGLPGGTPQYALQDLREQFNLRTPTERTVLLTFGGLGLAQIPYQTLEHFSDWQFITFDQQAPDLPNLVKITARQYRPVDFMPLCGRVVSKPGFSTFSEATRLDVPIVTLMREGFAEAPLLLEGIQDHARHQILHPKAFFQGEWDFLHQPVQPPRQSEPLPKDGNAAIAQAVVDFFAKQ